MLRYRSKHFGFARAPTFFTSSPSIMFRTAISTFFPLIVYYIPKEVTLYWCVSYIFPYTDYMANKLNLTGISEIGSITAGTCRGLSCSRMTSLILFTRSSENAMLGNSLKNKTTLSSVPASFL